MAAGTLTYTGDDSPQIRFRNSVQEVVSSGTVDASGGFQFPAKAGLYTVELVDACTDSVSYGFATVNSASFSGWSASPTVLNFDIGTVRNWPNATQFAGDFDSDGFSDLIYASGTLDGGGTMNPGVRLYRWNSGTSSFDSHSLIPEATSVFTMSVADFDGDGKLDLFYGVNASEKYKVAIGDGAGNFIATEYALPPTVNADIQYTRESAAVDIDRDGDTDIVMTGGNNPGGGWTTQVLYVMRNDGNGVFTGTVLEKPATDLYASLRFGDANDDGLLDVYVLTGSPVVLRRYLQKGDGSFANAVAGTDYLETTPSTALTAADQIHVGYLNGDEKADVVVMRSVGPSALFLSNSTDDTLATNTILAPTEQHGAGAQFADLDLDGTMDVFMPLKNRALFANRGAIWYKPYTVLHNSNAVNATNTITGTTVHASWAASEALFEDLNQDGIIDLFMTLTTQNKGDLVFGN